MFSSRSCKPFAKGEDIAKNAKTINNIMEPHQNEIDRLKHENETIEQEKVANKCKFDANERENGALKREIGALQHKMDVLKHKMDENNRENGALKCKDDANERKITENNKAMKKHEKIMHENVERYSNGGFGIKRTHQTKKISVLQGLDDFKNLLEITPITRSMPDIAMIRKVIAEIESNNCKQLGTHISHKLRDKQQTTKIKEMTKDGKVHKTLRYECSVVAMREHVKEYVFNKARALAAAAAQKD